MPCLDMETSTSKSTQTYTHYKFKYFSVLESMLIENLFFSSWMEDAK